MGQTNQSNVDQAEIAKFSSMAEDWWNPFGHCKPLHDINPLRLQFIQKHCSLEGLRILDVGCGGGILTESLAKAGGKVTGIDLSEEAIHVASQHAQQQGLSIDYRLSAVEDLVEDYAEQFDVITCMELLEHVPTPLSIINACAGLLKSNGNAFFSTLNRNLKAYMHAIIGAEYLLKLLPKGTHHYEKFIRPSEMFDMLSSVNLDLKDIAGLSYHPIFKTYKLTNDVSVNYLMACERS